MTSIHQAIVSEIDTFLAEAKGLAASIPHWAESHIPGRWTAQWPIETADGVLTEGTMLRFAGPSDNPACLSVSLFYRNHRIQAVDLVPGGICKRNPPDAGLRHGLPAEVCGSHFHEWKHNRHLALSVGPGRLNYRAPTPSALTRLPHALSALAQAVNLTLTPEQASFDVPPQGALLLKRGGGDGM